jgi:hypothetical protein
MQDAAGTLQKRVDDEYVKAKVSLSSYKITQLLLQEIIRVLLYINIFAIFVRNWASG